MNRNLVRLGLTSFALVAGSLPVLSQGTQTASATIEVVNASGAPVAGVSIRMTSPNLQGIRTGVTDGNGRFHARLLPPGTYLMELSKEGYQTAKATQTIGIDQNFQPRFVMQETAGATVVVVSSAAPAVDKTDVKTATNYQMEQVDLLPNGRTMEAVALLTPGVTTGVGGRVQVRGAMTSGNLYLLDGQNIADNAFNTRGVAVIDDAIEEVQILTGAISAEYGGVDGGVLNSITKSGSNDFSGQLRWELRNPAWNARQPTGVRYLGGAWVPNAPQDLENKLNEEKTLTIGGPIIKDRLWFFFAGYQTNRDTPLSISSGAVQGPGGAGSNYTRTDKEIRRQAKLTFSLNQNHSFVLSAQNSATDQVNRDYSAGELRALVPQKNETEFMNLAWRAIWMPNLTMEAKVGRKHQKLSAGGAANGQSPIYDYITGRFYNNGIFNNTDGGDNRDNRTADVKFTLFWDVLGSHQTDAGINVYRGISRARNEQTPTGYIIGSYNLDLINRTGFGSDIWTFRSGDGEATSTSVGLFLNDKWTLNQHWAFQVGFRLDKYAAQNEGGATTASATGFSPRFGVNYDLFGDSKFLFKASAARYNAKVLEAILNRVTSQGNPSEIDYVWTGAAFAAGGGDPSGPIPFADLQNIANYDTTSAGIVYYNDPKLNVRLNPDLKAPSVDEFQLSAAYSFNFGKGGDGFVRLTGVHKKWHDLIDNRIGNEGTINDPTGTPIYIQVWDNSSVAERKYSALEFDTQLNRGGWFVGGNITWSKLEGNYEGEGSSSPGRGEGLEAWTVVNGVQMFDRNVTAPYGHLSGHRPIRMRFNANRVYDHGSSKTTIGLVYRFDSGSHGSETRSITRARLNSALPSQFGTTTTMYRDGMRGNLVFNAASYLDLAVTHEFEIFKVKERSVRGLAKLVIGNIFNHQQVLTWNTTYAAATGAANAGVSSPWVPLPVGTSTAYGRQTSSGNYGDARTYAISAGFRF